MQDQFSLISNEFARDSDLFLIGIEKMKQTDQNYELLSKINDRLNHQLLEKEREIDHLKSNTSKLEESNKKLMQLMQIIEQNNESYIQQLQNECNMQIGYVHSLHIQLDKASQETNELKCKLKLEKQQNAQQYLAQQKQMQQQQQTIINETTTLHKYQNKFKQIESLTQQISSMQNEHKAKEIELNNQISLLNNDIILLKEKIKSQASNVQNINSDINCTSDTLKINETTFQNNNNARREQEEEEQNKITFREIESNSQDKYVQTDDHKSSQIAEIDQNMKGITQIPIDTKTQTIYQQQADVNIKLTRDKHIQTQQKEKSERIAKNGINFRIERPEFRLSESYLIKDDENEYEHHHKQRQMNEYKASPNYATKFVSSIIVSQGSQLPNNYHHINDSNKLHTQNHNNNINLSKNNQNNINNQSNLPQLLESLFIHSSSSSSLLSQSKNMQVRKSSTSINNKERENQIKDIQTLNNNVLSIPLVVTLHSSNVKDNKNKQKIETGSSSRNQDIDNSTVIGSSNITSIKYHLNNNDDTPIISQQISNTIPTDKNNNNPHLNNSPTISYQFSQNHNNSQDEFVSDDDNIKFQDDNNNQKKTVLQQQSQQEQDELFNKQQLQLIQEELQQERAFSTDLEEHVKSMEEVFQQFKEEKVSYEEKIIDLVENIVQLQQQLSISNSEKEQWFKLNESKAKQIEEYQKKLAHYHIDLISTKINRFSSSPSSQMEYFSEGIKQQEDGIKKILLLSTNE